jgi:hypothetical protein
MLLAYLEFVNILNQWETLVNNSKQVTWCMPAAWDGHWCTEAGILWLQLYLRTHICARGGIPTCFSNSSLVTSLQQFSHSLQICTQNSFQFATLSLAAVSTTPWRHGAVQCSAVEIELLALVTLALYGWYHALAILAKPKRSQYPLHMSPGGAQYSSEQDYKEKYLCPCEELNPHSPVPSLVATLRYPCFHIPHGKWLKYPPHIICIYTILKFNISLIFSQKIYSTVPVWHYKPYNES